MALAGTPYPPLLLPRQPGIVITLRIYEPFLVGVLKLSLYEPFLVGVQKGTCQKQHQVRRKLLCRSAVTGYDQGAISCTSISCNETVLAVVPHPYGKSLSGRICPAAHCAGH